MQLAQAVVWCAVGATLAVAGVLLLRRLDGAFHEPLAAGELVATGLVVAGWAATIRTARYWRSCSNRATTLNEFAYGCLLSLAVGLLGMAVTNPASPVWALVSLWGTLGIGELAYWGPRVRFGPGSLVRHLRPTHSTIAPAQGRERGPQKHCGPTQEDTAWSREAERDEEDAGEQSEILAPEVCQRIIRAKADDGSAVVYGLVRCEFSENQRQQNVHVAFCPPLARKPQFDAEQVLGPKITLKPLLVETFGASLEVRLVGPSTASATVQIQFYAAELPPHAPPA